MRMLALAFLFQSAALLAQTASIQGTVADATNHQPIAGALVTAVRAGLPPASQTATTGSDGAFQVQHLPAGAYSLCVQVPGDTYLDLCQWSPASAAKVTLAAGQTSSGNALKIDKGSVLQVHIDDPGHLLAQKTSRGRDPQILIGVWGASSLFFPVHATSKDTAGANFQVTVPRDTPLKLNVASKDLKLSNASGAAIAATGDQQPFQHATGDANPKSFRYTITGVIP